MNASKPLFYTPPLGAVMTVAYLGGILARSESLMRSHWDHAKAFIDDAALADAQRAQEQAYADAQAGLDYLAPALASWQDLFRPFAKSCPGVQPESLMRTFETNTFHRQPHVTGELQPPALPHAPFRLFACQDKPWVLTLPSPYDLAVRSRDEHYGDTGALAVAWGKALAPVVAAARKQGSALVRFHEPSALYARHDVDVEALAAGLVATRAGEASLHLTNGDPFERGEVLEANPLPGLSIEDPGRKPPRLALPNGTRLSAAVIAGEDSLVEDPAECRRRALQLARDLDVGLWGITNGWDLEHVPHAIALAKIEALKATAQLLRKVPA
jgi:methionine synthase II (cobalamin-independent)